MPLLLVSSDLLKIASSLDFSLHLSFTVGIFSTGVECGGPVVAGAPDGVTGLDCKLIRLKTGFFMRPAKTYSRTFSWSWGNTKICLPACLLARAVGWGQPELARRQKQSWGSPTPPPTRGRLKCCNNVAVPPPAAAPPLFPFFSFWHSLHVPADPASCVYVCASV